MGGSLKVRVARPRATRSSGSPSPGVPRDLALGLLPLLIVVLATWWQLRLRATYVLHAAALYLLLAVTILRLAPAGARSHGLGAANRVTLARATLTLPVAALVLHAGVLATADYWWIVGLATSSIVLDGLDGRVARRTGSATDFGARFDMELDAFLLLALSVLVSLAGKAGSWVILIGALRYLFVGASRLWPALGRELPPSRRRRAVCAVQGVVLVACLVPPVPPPAASAAAAGALALLVHSFAADVRWLLWTAGGSPAERAGARRGRIREG